LTHADVEIRRNVDPASLTLLTEEQAASRNGMENLGSGAQRYAVIITAALLMANEQDAE
jgi:hypothetical protein